MSSTTLMVALTVVYVIILVMALYERNWSRALYWLGATVINIALLYK